MGKSEGQSYNTKKNTNSTIMASKYFNYLHGIPLDEPNVELTGRGPES